MLHTSRGMLDGGGCVVRELSWRALRGHDRPWGARGALPCAAPTGRSWHEALPAASKSGAGARDPGAARDVRERERARCPSEGAIGRAQEAVVSALGQFAEWAAGAGTAGAVAAAGGGDVAAAAGIGNPEPEIGCHLVSTETGRFNDMTSVHINSEDQAFMASGYHKSVPIFDLATGKRVLYFEDIHEKSINIARFANETPHLLATCSFDRAVKVWDMRVGSSAPIYTCASRSKNVLIAFSPDDQYMLTSA